jgi:hypothetical protein
MRPDKLLSATMASVNKACSQHNTQTFASRSVQSDGNCVDKLAAFIDDRWHRRVTGGRGMN